MEVELVPSSELLQQLTKSEFWHYCNDLYEFSILKIPEIAHPYRITIWNKYTELHVIKRRNFLYLDDAFKAMDQERRELMQLLGGTINQQANPLSEKTGKDER